MNTLLAFSRCYIGVRLPGGESRSVRYELRLATPSMNRPTKRDYTQRGNPRGPHGRGNAPHVEL